jgi:hypothetical protein
MVFISSLDSYAGQNFIIPALSLQAKIGHKAPLEVTEEALQCISANHQNRIT